KTGIPIGNIQEGFKYTLTYANQLTPLCYPLDTIETGPYPFYDRWGDAFNVVTECSSTDLARSVAVAAWLAAGTLLATQAWSSTNATILVPTNMPSVGQ